jgi:DNA-binding PadR family transcriptional regulator
LEQYEKNQVRVSLLRRFIDLIALEELKKSEMSGYDLVFRLHSKYDLLVSPGTVYALLYSLERQGLIEGKMEDRKRVYEITNRGLENASLLKRECKEVALFLANLGA